MMAMDKSGRVSTVSSDGFYVGSGRLIQPCFVVAESDAERLDAFARFFADGCLSGDCPHETQRECADSILAAALAVYETTT